MIKDHLTYFEGKHLVKSTSTTWTHKDSKLNSKLFNESLDSKKYPEVSFFNSYMTKFFAIDIDNHSDRFNILNVAYKELCTKFAEPSFVVKSPRGLHAYYLLKDFYSSQILVKSVYSLIKKFTYAHAMEIRPTVKSGLRVPSARHVLNTKDLMPVRMTSKSFERYIEKRVHYSPSEFLNDQILRETTKAIPSGTISQGATNVALNYFVPLWRSRGLDEEQITDKFIENLESSYVGECTSRTRMLKRVHSYFKNFEPEPIKFSISNEELELKYSDVITNVLSRYSNKNKYNENLRLNSIKEDLLKILAFKDLAEQTYNDRETKFLHAAKNPYFRFEMARGCVPIASSKIRNKNLNFFKSIGLLSLPYGKHYDVARRSCIHYMINLDSFTCNKPVIRNNIISRKPVNCFKLFVYQNSDENEEFTRLTAVLEPHKPFIPRQKAIKVEGLESLF